MDICAHIGLSVSEDVNSLPELYTDSPESTPRVIGDLSVDELGNSITEFLNIQDEQESLSGSVLPSGKHGVEKKDVCGEPHSSKFTTVITSEKCLSKSESFPCSRKMSSAAASVGEENDGEAKDGANDITTEVLTHNDNVNSVIPPYSRSISLPTPLKLVSAMKGSREKQGAPPMKLTVKWAPYVYDPTPTAVSHVVRSSKPQKHGKKNAKNKQKGGSKSSRGSKGKDKKQARKHGGSCSNRGFKLLDYDEKVIEFCEPHPSSVDFHVGNPDQFCGSSFFKKSVSSLHFSVAEAT